MGLGLWSRLHHLWRRLLLAAPSGHHHWKARIGGIAKNVCVGYDYY
jgi:hypothetical protein